MSPARPLELITKGQWEKALFTTYALSLSFYETQLHKLGLRRQGCRDIQIITDVDGYQLSLSERQSMAVGSEFELIPAALPNGVFHPKIIWLQGKEIDLLLLGSGNLTFGGFGKNVECLEVFRSDQHPQIFTQIAEMFHDWQQREDLRFGKISWFGEWTSRGQSLRPKETDSNRTTPRPFLLHSTLFPIGNQLIDLARQHRGVREVRSLSPFYDPDARGILAFAEQLDCQKLTIGLLPGREEKTTFPFKLIEQPKFELQAALIKEAGEDKRRLHAKIIELALNDGTVWTLTGSVNATQKSLMTNDNIETAILRQYPKSSDSPFHWTECPPPGNTASVDFSKAGLKGRVVVTATLNQDGLLTGSVICSTNPAGIWKAFFHMLDGTMIECDLEIDSQGQFECDLSLETSLTMAQGLQLELRKEDMSGKGWVTLEHFLSATRRSFLSPTVLINLLRPNAEEEDVAELLRYLSVNASRHLNAVSPQTGTRNSSSSAELDAKGKGADSRSVSIEWIKSSASLERNATDDEKSPESKSNDTLDQFIRRILHNLKSAGTRESDAQDTESNQSPAEQEREQKEREQRKQNQQKTVAQFHEAMEKLITDLKGSSQAWQALCLWLEAGLSPMLRGHEDTEDAEAFLVKWKFHALKHHRLSNSPELLTHYILETIFTLAAIYSVRSEASGTWQKRLSLLHEELEAFMGDESPQDHSKISKFLDDADHSFVSRLLSLTPDSPSLSDGQKKLFESPTTIQQLAELERRASSGEDISYDLPLARTSEGKDYFDMVSTGQSPVRVGILIREPKDMNGPAHYLCSGCYLRLRPAELNKLQSNRLIRCSNCQRFVTHAI